MDAVQHEQRTNRVYSRYHIQLGAIEAEHKRDDKQVKRLPKRVEQWPPSVDGYKKQMAKKQFETGFN